MIYIVSGPSSVGKSTLIEDGSLATWWPSISPSAQVLFPADVEADPALLNGRDTIVHYNMLRPFTPPSMAPNPLARLLSALGQSQLLAKTIAGKACRVAGRQLVRHRERKVRDRLERADYSTDAAWQAIVDLPAEKSALVLIAPKTLLLERMHRRHHVERSLVADRSLANPTVHAFASDSYPMNTMQRVLEATPVGDAYRTYLRELDRAGIPWTLVESTPQGLIAAEATSIDRILDAEVTATATKYTLAEIEGMLGEADFEYQRVPLPYGLSTPGDDRSKTANLVLPSDLHGFSVLDVGSAYGALCFEAEQRGASEVLGVDVNRKRLAGAELIKEILNSNVIFEERDLLEHPLDRDFDYILLLNVIHHLNEPIAMIRALARRTRRTLTIEYPNFDDPRYPSRIPSDMKSALNREPLMGVSSRDVDQTFLFTDAAIDRILRDHDSLVNRISFRPSMIPGRRVAVCHMKDTDT